MTTPAEAVYPSANTVSDFAERLQRVKDRIKKAAGRVGRASSDVTLLPVSKTVDSERIRIALCAGITDLGENKVQEALRKSVELADVDGLRWHVIGHLQSNKAKSVARFAHEFQALDSLKVARALNSRLEIDDRTLEVFIQVNTSKEDSKYGLPPGEVAAFLAALPAFERLKVKGLMTLAINSDDTERVRGCFRELRQLRDGLHQTAPDGVELTGLSMGMSGDFELGVEEGATVVRVGQAIFGARSRPDSYYWPGT